ncbi:RND efflux system, inner membrane transporter [hydrothermal vent metagenome]|uniref:RND efflux system, inner membrane transporter n=1 Tax=hydrothermal vent metagenome TaxID=652676 RepID=A0A3B0TCB6_9ZZZZ
MNLSDLSIRRPVLAAVMSLLIVVLGIAALMQLPVRELPDIDSAIVTVSTGYTGAAPSIVDTDITELIESAVAGVSGIKSISSSSRRGRSRTVIEFEIGRNIDEAANDIRDAVGRVRSRLPDEADEPRVIKNDSDAAPVMRLAVSSPAMSAAEITDYVERFIVDRFATLEGVASVDIYGRRGLAVRIWLDRRALAARNLTVADIEAALRRNNIELPAGEIQSRSRRMTVRLDSRISTVAQFRQIVVDRIAGYPVRLADVADVERDVENRDVSVRANGIEAVGLGVVRQSQANTIVISNAVRAEIAALNPLLPQGMTISVGSDDAIFIGASIRQVLIALGLSLALVVLVILVFLMSARATLVPAVTIPVALIGSFIFIGLMGFSINILTLLALLLAIGLVVDDAIVVLENIQRRIDGGESPMVASVLGTRQVTFAVLATSVTLVAVFVPISYLEGQAGRLFAEFGFVLAGAVVISTFVALSLCPVLASLLLKPRDSGDGGKPVRPKLFDRIAVGYGRMLRASFHAPLIVIAVAIAFAGGGYKVYQSLPRELAPKEDRGFIFIPLSTPQGSTSSFTDAQARKLETSLEPLRGADGVDTVFAIVGIWGGPNRAFVGLRLKPWGERGPGQDQNSIVRKLMPKVGALTGARGFPIVPTGLGLHGGRTPVRVVIGGPDFESVKKWAGEMLTRARANPGLRNAEIDFEENQPQLNLAVDRARADDLDISVQTIAATLQTMLASRQVTDFIERGRSYPVLLQARAEDRRTPGDISNIFVRSGDGRTLVPLNALVTATEAAAASTLRRYDRLPSIVLTASLAQGYDLGTALDDMEALAAEILPPQAKINFAGQSQQFRETSSGVAVTFALAVLIVFLVLAAQFESFLHPVIIMLSVPLAVAGAIYSLAAGGLSLNIYSQIGIILLIGLMAKNGILIVEFANQLRDQGRSVREAVIEASVIRFRPIVMTIISTILGAVPLVIATGAGAEARNAIGTVVIGGLGLAALMTLFLTPVLYDLLARFTRPRGAIEAALEVELGEAGKGAKEIM